MTVCPTCGAEFADLAGGFCPHDGGRLKPAHLVVRPRTPPPGSPPPPAIAPPGAVSAKDESAEVIARLLRGDESGYDRLIGQTLDGRYKIVEKLGEGGMGVVFLAHHVVIEKQVAIKVLKREVAREDSVVKRFMQEARAASRIGHPNIVDVTDFGTTPDGLIYQVMEYVEGPTLAMALRDVERMGVARALPIVAQLCRALGAAHDKGIVHRDLKPENIFLSRREGRKDFVKLVDFGIAKVSPAAGDPEAPRLTRAGLVFGTPEYMAPEQAAGRVDSDRRLDVYALGTILYEMLVGRVPFRADTPVRTIAMVLMDPVVRPRAALPGLVMSDALEAAIMKALSKPKEQRFPTMAAFLDALAGAAGDVALELPLSPGLIDPSGPIGMLASPSGGAPAPVSGPDRETLPMTTGDRGHPPPPAPRPDAGAQPPTLKPPPPAPPFGPPSIGGSPAWVPAAPLPLQPTDRTEAVPAIRTRRYAPLAIGAAAVVIAGGATAAGLGLFADRGAAGPRGAAPAAHAVAVTAADAGPAAPSIPPAAPPATIDAGPAALTPSPDAGPVAAPARRRDRRPRTPPIAPDPTREVELVIKTRPPEGKLYVDRKFAGPDDLNIRRQVGTVLDVTCELAGHEPGAVRVIFDGDHPIYYCPMKSKSKCVAGVKNPYVECPVAP